jgi:hypothetical protein
MGATTQRGTTAGAVVIGMDPHADAILAARVQAARYDPSPMTAELLHCYVTGMAPAWEPSTPECVAFLPGRDLGSYPQAVVVLEALPCRHGHPIDRHTTTGTLARLSGLADPSIRGLHVPGSPHRP